MIAMEIIYCGPVVVLACDARCDRAWGITIRPRVDADLKDQGSHAFQTDSELGEAPADPLTREGGVGKPRNPEERLNKWCTRECERSVMVAPGEDFDLPDFA